MIIFSGKAKDMTLLEFWLVWNFGRPFEELEPEDFSEN